MDNYKNLNANSVKYIIQRYIHACECQAGCEHSHQELIGLKETS